MNTQTQNYWKKCSSCKKEIPFSSKYYVCSVSTCRHKRKGFQFCSVPCWDAHLGFANHRESWAIEEKSPATVEREAQSAHTATNKTPVRSPKRMIVPGPREFANSKPLPQRSSESPATSQAVEGIADAIHTDVLVVVSKVKKLISDQSGFNTSQCCVDALTKKVIAECLKGIENAKQAGRKTVMGRDIVKK